MRLRLDERGLECEARYNNPNVQVDLEGKTALATYVTSDAHGHARALDRALELAQPGSNDAVFVLGDMVDRGPDPLGVVRIVRSLPLSLIHI